ncbi:hypothetical protein CB1_000998025 [Camelus ferus]|nr:hypothetical protein CB1_000998025 [Camelus ferus]
MVIQKDELQQERGNSEGTVQPPRSWLGGLWLAGLDREEEKRKHKKQQLVRSPSSHLMDVKCPGCYKITALLAVHKQ